MKDYSNYHTQSKDKFIHDAKKVFNVHLDGYEGHIGTIDGVENKFLLKRSTNGTKKYFEIQSILCEVDVNVFRGSLVTDQNNNLYIVTSNVINNGFYKIAEIQKPNNHFKFFNEEDSRVYEIPCIIEKQISLDNDEVKLITTVSNEFYCIVPNTPITRKIKVNDVFKIGLSAYTIITKPDDISAVGLLIFKLKYNEGEQYIPTFSIEIVNGEQLTLPLNSSLKLEVQVKKDNLVLDTPLPYSFEVLNGEILSIDEDGTIIPLSVGETLVICKLKNDFAVYDSVYIKVEEVTLLDNSFTILIEGDNSVKLNDTVVLKAKILNNGVLDPSQSVVWEVVNGQYADILSQDNNTIVLKAPMNSSFVNKKIIVKAIKSDDDSIYAEHEIKIKNLF